MKIVDFYILYHVNLFLSMIKIFGGVPPQSIRGGVPPQSIRVVRSTALRSDRSSDIWFPRRVYSRHAKYDRIKNDTLMKKQPESSPYGLRRRK